MQVHTTKVTDTKTKLGIVADAHTLDEIKKDVLNRLQKDVKLPGFRGGKVPLELVEKNVSPQTLQNEFLDAALNALYSRALSQEDLRPIDQPSVNITKFVPFTTLEFDAEIEVIGDIKLPDYSKIKIKKEEVSVTDKDVEEVIERLRLRAAEKKDVDRAAADTDEVWIDFEGRDAKSGEPVKGGDGKDYPLALGSNTFIPGFEDNLLGAKPGEEREFTLSFPGDYGVKALQGRKVTFKVKVKKVTEVSLPKTDDGFASKVGPFKTFAELKTDIKKQIHGEREFQNDRNHESDILKEITDKSKVAVPQKLIEQELDRIEQEERQNIVYRGQTWEEHLEQEGVTEEEHREKNRAGAETRVKAGLVLGEIAEKEKVNVTPDELAIRIQVLKGQYQDPEMQKELEKPENRREIASRMLTEKTLALLVKDLSGSKK